MINFFKKYMWTITAIISLILVPKSLNIQSELSMRIVVTAIGVDYTDGQFEVTAQVVRPSKDSTSQGSSEGLDFVSAKADTIADGMYQISFVIGKTAGLGHVNAILFGQSLVDANMVVPSIDYFIRDARIPTSCLLLVCDGETKDELKKTQSLELSTAVGLQKLFLYKEQSMNGSMVQLEKFANDYYKIGSTGIISGLKFESEEEGANQSRAGTSNGSSGGSSSDSGSGQGGSSGTEGGSSGGSSSSSSGGSSSQPKQRIAYSNDVYLFVNGNKVLTLKKGDGVEGLNFLNPKSKSGIISLENVSGDGYYNNANVSVFLRDKKVKLDCRFVDGKPKCVIKISTSRNEVIEIDNEHEEKIETLYVQKNLLTKVVEDKIKEKIKAEVQKTFDMAKECGADIMHLGEYLYSANPKEWKAFYQNSGTNYIKDLDIEIEVNIAKQL